jgi:hypothetical protein
MRALLELPGVGWHCPPAAGGGRLTLARQAVKLPGQRVATARQHGAVAILARFRYLDGGYGGGQLPRPPGPAPGSPAGCVTCVTPTTTTRSRERARSAKDSARWPTPPTWSPPVQVGLLERAFTGTEFAAEADRLVCSASADVA